MIVPCLAAHHRAFKRDHGAMVFGIALISQHDAVAVDNAGRWRHQGGGAGQRRFHLPRGVAADFIEIIDPVVGGLHFDVGKGLDFLFTGGDDQLAAIGVRDTVGLAIFVELPFSGNAESRLQAILGVVDAGVDDFAVAG